LKEDWRMSLLRSIGLFVAAGLAEIGGGYLVWRWLREGSPWPVGVAGAVILVVYGIIPTLLWGWAVDGHRPDNYDWLGAAIVAVGVGVIYFAPRPR
jgi:small multidrug resistance family-3 protein